MGFGLACMVIPGLFFAAMLGVFVATWLGEPGRGLFDSVKRTWT